MKEEEKFDIILTIIRNNGLEVPAVSLMEMVEMKITIDKIE